MANTLESTEINYLSHGTCPCANKQGAPGCGILTCAHSRCVRCCQVSFGCMRMYLNRRTILHGSTSTSSLAQVWKTTACGDTHATHGLSHSPSVGLGAALDPFTFVQVGAQAKGLPVESADMCAFYVCLCVLCPGEPRAPSITPSAYKQPLAAGPTQGHSLRGTRRGRRLNCRKLRIYLAKTSISKT